jgi:hypothetical protein
MGVAENWQSHTWVLKRGEEFLSAARIRLRKFECRVCGRAFAADETGDKKWAIDQYGEEQIEVDGARLPYPALRPEISDRWLAESCPGERLARDDEDRKRLA